MNQVAALKRQDKDRKSKVAPSPRKTDAWSTIDAVELSCHGAEAAAHLASAAAQAAQASQRQFILGRALQPATDAASETLTGSGFSTAGHLTSSGFSTGGGIGGEISPVVRDAISVEDPALLAEMGEWLSDLAASSGDMASAALEGVGDVAGAVLEGVGEVLSGVL